MDELSAVLVSKALDGLLMRQTVLAQNIANAGSDSYAEMSVAFEEELRRAAGEGAGAVRGTEAVIQYKPVDEFSAEMRIDLALAEASQTTMRYGALINLLGRQMSLSMSVVRGGQ